MINLSDLNDQQSASVMAIDGPVLVLAGAGTGKTKVLITRIANIIASGKAQPEQILGVTFTNKAAKEMKERLARILGDMPSVWLGTFHSICVRLLRMYYQAAGLQPNFVIIDDDERTKILKQVAVELNIDDKRYPVKLLSFAISSLKEKGINYQDEDKVLTFKYRDLDLVALYKTFQEKLKFFNLVDFDDIILYTVNILRNNKDILNDLQERFRYIVVDEYQDTGCSQSIFLRLLAAKYQNICCVGDEDQSIYSWRGADVGNILNFEKHFPRPTIIRLEQNYRSTQNILTVASSVIQNNKSRYGKILHTTIGSGDKVEVVHAYDNNQEASAIAKRVEKYHSEKQVDYNSMAVLVRAAYQMRSIEEIFTRNSVPYRIVDGIRFYDRKEIKDLVAYLRLVYSDSDQPALERIINVPKRGIGAKTLESLTGNSNFTGVPVVLALRSMVGKIEFSKKINEEMESFLDKLDYWRAMSQSKEASLSQLVEAIANQSGYIQMLEAEAVEDPSAKSRIENVREFLSALSQFSSIDEFLEHIALFNAKDSSQEESAVNIMTIHASKGLEYDVVFLPGWEEGVFPSYRSLEDGGDSGLEEERRLAYVAITRARKWLTIIHVKTRFTFGKWNDAVKSRFVKEIADGTTADVVTFLNIAGFDSAGNQQNNMRDDYSQIEPSNYKKNSSLAPAVSSQPFLPEFAVDERIKHLKFGNGVVVSIVSQYAEVLFDDGCKHLIHRKFLLPLD